MPNDVTPAMYRYADDLIADVWTNIETLHRKALKDNLREYLYDWAIYLGALALDVFEADVELIRMRRFRVQNLLSRSLIDYDIRLRYYYVQSIPAIRAYERYPTEKNRQAIDAVVDYDDWQFSLKKKLTTYPPSVWAPEHKSDLQQALLDVRKARQRNFIDMVDYLRQNEVRARRLVWKAIEDAEDHLEVQLAHWINASAYTHGDQAAVTDVIQYGEDLKKTGTIFRHSPNEYAKTAFFSATFSMLAILDTFGMIHGVVYNAVGNRVMAGRLFASNDHDHAD